MRWIHLDKILQLDRGVRCVAIKNVTAAEDVLHDHFPARPAREAAPGVAALKALPAMPLAPHSLIIEGMAQTAGILVGHAKNFEEKVILAKITRAEFSSVAGPGETLRHTATIERMDDTGGVTVGITEKLDPTTGIATPLAKIDLMFAHLDQNRAGTVFPEHNFVFSSQLRDLLEQSGIA